MLAETLSMAKQAEAQRDMEVKKAAYNEAVKKQQAQADKAYEIQTNVMLQQVTAEAVKVQQIEREQQIKVQEAEIQRREKELVATVLKQAEAALDVLAGERGVTGEHDRATHLLDVRRAAVAATASGRPAPWRAGCGRRAG